jgi:hypothetical protein
MLRIESADHTGIAEKHDGMFDNKSRIEPLH